MRPTAIACALLFACSSHGASLQDSLDTVRNTNRQAAEADQRISELSSQTRAMLEEYRQLQTGSDLQGGQVEELQALKQRQEQEITQLRQRIAAAQEAQLRLAPLMAGMAEALQKFIELDLPFQREERLARIASARALLSDPGATAQQRLRSLLEVWQVELDYGRSVEAWRGPLQRDADTRSVDYLRIGRTALYYQTLDGGESGMWDPARGSWEVLPASYNYALRQSMKVAQKRSAPSLMEVPLRAAQAAEVRS